MQIRKRCWWPAKPWRRCLGHTEASLSHRFFVPVQVKVAYEKVMGAKGGTASMELRQTIRSEPTLDEQLTSLASCRVYELAR